jgi:maltose phosphorylase
LAERSADVLTVISAKGFDIMLAEQAAAWAEKWKHNDIIIEGDAAAQQGIRFNIFQLNQTYTGEDDRLNIGPKGFTGEKYGGSTYWDTEAYCVPFYLATAEQKVARNLLCISAISN